MSYSNTLDDIHAEARRLIDAASERDLQMRLFGGVAVYALCASAHHPALARTPKDIDLIGLAAQRAPIQQLFAEHGYGPNREFNLLHGASRLLFYDSRMGRQVDIFLDQFQMCHRFDMRERLGLHELTLAPADLLLTKLQVVQASENDLRDSFALLVDLPLGPGKEAIDVEHIAGLAARDWGLYRTLTLSLERLAQWGAGRETLGSFPLQSQIAALRQALEAAPKTMAWKLRARVGDRVRWYDTPDEVE